MTCKYCGKEMYQASEWDMRCDCGANYWHKEGYEIWEEPDNYEQDEEYFNISELPKSCTDCGNPHYPECTQRCDLVKTFQ